MQSEIQTYTTLEQKNHKAILEWWHQQLSYL